MRAGRKSRAGNWGGGGWGIFQYSEVGICYFSVEILKNAFYGDSLAYVNYKELEFTFSICPGCS